MGTPSFGALESIPWLKYTLLVWATTSALIWECIGRSVLRLQWMVSAMVHIHVTGLHPKDLREQMASPKEQRANT